jgi:hypothetical protein
LGVGWTLLGIGGDGEGHLCYLEDYGEDGEDGVVPVFCSEALEGAHGFVGRLGGTEDAHCLGVEAPQMHGHLYCCQVAVGRVQVLSKGVLEGRASVLVRPERAGRAVEVEEAFPHAGHGRTEGERGIYSRPGAPVHSLASQSTMHSQK